ncbi:8146_t:CDS:2 [Paraglomus brasilianum]|uniref:Calcium-transporting ATPase n=1 Tax=Paraglomus brasilianum TaxID=144538 RepID=A0A9N9AZ80_9GLOM|nr:8146_t:CDS:2 [Paraglomus brasilianum]
MPVSTSERTPLLDRDQDSGPFAFTPEQLYKLVDPKDPNLLNSYGGVKGITDGLRVNPDNGLSSDEGLDSHRLPFEERRKFYGKNVLPDVAQQSFFSLVWEAYKDKTLILLSVAAIVSLAIGISEDFSSRHPDDEPRVGWVEGAAIVAAVAAVVFTNAINDYSKEKQFRKLNAKKEDRDVKLIRNGKEQQISVHEINVGDIMLLEPGDIIAVDGVYISGHNLTCDESSATGESDTIKKNTLENNGDPIILSGSKVLEGVGKAVVIAVGPNSFFGKTMIALRGSESDETPLQMKLDLLAEQIAKLGICAALLMLITLTAKYFITAAMADEFPDIADILPAVITIVIQAITIVVVAVPEGLPMAVALALAYATTQMLKDNNLVRVLSACETMGNATTVCSDKTGTLTQNKMTVVEGKIAQETFEGLAHLDSWRSKISDAVFDVLIEGITANSSAFEDKGESGRVDFVGSKTECALLGFAKHFGVDYRERRSAVQAERVYPFASKKKTMTTVIKLPPNAPAKSDPNAEYRVHVKGASEIVLKSCNRYINANGQIKELDESGKQQVEITITMFADKALRTIGLAYKDATSSEAKKFNDDDAPNDNLILLGIVGIQDPLRPDVKLSVEQFKKAGVFVRMITGDNILTARAIARDAGILTKGVALTGPEFRAMSPDEQRRIVPRLQVLARSSPTDKTIVVTRLKELDEIVAVTGDGTNDGPALKLADVGFSMGIAGTEVAKEASSIILMDDSFSSIVSALKWGRAVNDSVRKFLQFQLTVNITAVILSFVSAVMSDESESILTAVQLLWVNLIMDTLAALALATEPPTDEVLDRYPTSKNASLVNYRMWKMIIGQAVFQIAVNLTLLHIGPAVFHLSDSPHDKAALRTIIFNTFVFLQVFNEINCRRIDDHLNVFRNILNNHVFILIQLIVIGGQFFIVEFGGVAFGTVSLTGTQWLVTVIIGFLSLPIGLIIRLLPNWCVPEHILNEEVKPMTPEKMVWQSAYADVTRRMRVFNALRKPPRKLSNKPKIDRSSSSHSNASNNFADVVRGAMRPSNHTS